MKEREESFSIFVVGERIYNVKFNVNAQTWLLNHYWVFLLEYFVPPRGGLGPKGCVGHTLMFLSTVSLLFSKKHWCAHSRCNMKLSLFLINELIKRVYLERVTR